MRSARSRAGRIIAGGAWLVVIGCLAWAVTPLLAEEEPSGGEAPPQEVKQIKMYAENWKWTPNVIRVTQGTLVRIEIENLDAPHRFDLKEYKLKVPLPQDETTVVEFVAEKVGTFRWRCGRPCGNGCPKMTGELIVE